MNGEAKWIWDALVKHYGFFRVDSMVPRSIRTKYTADIAIKE
jgi:hypothetical protein